MSEEKTVEWLWDIVCKLDEMTNKRIDDLEGWKENFLEDISVKLVELKKQDGKKSEGLSRKRRGSSALVIPEGLKPSCRYAKGCIYFEPKEGEK